MPSGIKTIPTRLWLAIGMSCVLAGCNIDRRESGVHSNRQPVRTPVARYCELRLHNMGLPGYYFELYSDRSCVYSPSPEAVGGTLSIATVTEETFDAIMRAAEALNAEIPDGVMISCGYKFDRIDVWTKQGDYVEYFWGGGSAGLRDCASDMSNSRRFSELFEQVRRECVEAPIIEKSSESANAAIEQRARDVRMSAPSRRFGIL